MTIKNIVITGASSGLGRVLAAAQAEKGHNVCALARNAGKLDELKSQYPDRVAVFPVDVSKPADVKQVFGGIMELHKRIDVLINNAGIFNSSPFAEETIENIERIIDTNLKGLMYCTHAAIPTMIAQQSGRIINISSVSGINGIPGQAVYGASKHGLQGFSDVISQELKEHNILVTDLCPGAIATPLWNDGNPYPGVSDNMIGCEQIADLVDFLLEQPDRTLYKKLVFFPVTEWHSDD